MNSGHEVTSIRHHPLRCRSKMDWTYISRLSVFAKLRFSADVSAPQENLIRIAGEEFDLVVRVADRGRVVGPAVVEQVGAAEAHRLKRGALRHLLNRGPIVVGLGHVRVGDQRIPEVIAAHFYHHGLCSERTASAFKGGIRSPAPRWLGKADGRVTARTCGFDDCQHVDDVFADGCPLIRRKLDQRELPTGQVLLMPMFRSQVIRTVHPASSAARMRSPFWMVDHPRGGSRYNVIAGEKAAQSEQRVLVKQDADAWHAAWHTR